ncbi:hypothetical protein [Endozoicomonas sp. Mp262]|uniref:hypothetical protein n=1 Tax=Endozoicomonas sp. Mp262 TaxID=2919499 RepID=UPI0021DA4F33
MNVLTVYKNKKQSVFRWLKPAGSFRGNSLIVFDERGCEIPKSPVEDYFAKGGIIGVKFYDTSSEVSCVSYIGNQDPVSCMLTSFAKMEIKRGERYKKSAEPAKGAGVSRSKSKVSENKEVDSKGKLINELERNIRTRTGESVLSRLRASRKGSFTVSDAHYKLEKDIDDLRKGQGGMGKKGRQDYQTITQIIANTPRLGEVGEHFGFFK